MDYGQKIYRFNCSFLHSTYLISQLLISTDVTQYSLSNRDPMWKFVLGFNHDTNGQYSNEDLSYVSQFAIGDERKAAENGINQRKNF